MGIKNPDKVWVTKYALTKGIFHMEVIKYMGDAVYGPRIDDNYYGKGREWFTNKKEAIANAKHRRQVSIYNKKNELKRLRSIDFKKSIVEVTADEVTGGLVYTTPPKKLKKK